MLKPTTRLTLQQQVLQSMRQAIQSKIWHDFVPREKELCRQLGVGRNTVRAAIAVLTNEGWIAPGGRGCQHRVLQHSQAQHKPKGEQPLRGIVRMLSSEPFHELAESSSAAFNTMREMLRPRGYGLVYESNQSLLERFSAKRLERLVGEDETRVWLLRRQTMQVQQWFAMRGLPSLVLGSVFPGVNLPSVSYDVKAAVRHAALMFARRGHRSAAYLVPQRLTATEQLSVDGFMATQTECPQCKLHLLEHDTSITSIVRTVMSSRMGRNPVSAYLVLSPDHMITVLSTLMKSRVRIPEDVSLISLGSHKIMLAAVPRIACYDFNGVHYGRLVAKRLLSVLEGVNTGHDEILPDFIQGESV